MWTPISWRSKPFMRLNVKKQAGIPVLQAGCWRRVSWFLFSSGGDFHAECIEDSILAVCPVLPTILRSEGLKHQWGGRGKILEVWASPSHTLLLERTDGTCCPVILKHSSKGECLELYISKPLKCSEFEVLQTEVECGVLHVCVSVGTVKPTELVNSLPP